MNNLLQLVSTLLALLVPTFAVNNGLGLTPPLGWRSFNAFWGIVDQVKMETIMDAMVDKSRKVGGKPSSLLELGLFIKRMEHLFGVIGPKEGCNEHQFEGEMVATIMKGSVKAVADMGWDGLKLDS
eukprot:gene22538-15707_t